MLTRSKLNLRGIPYKQFYEQLCNPRNILYPKSQPFSNESSNPQINTKDFGIYYRKEDIKECEDIDNNTYKIGNVLLIDIETFKHKNSKRLREGMWFPFQIAWGVYRYDGDSKTIKCLQKRMYHVEECVTEKEFFLSLTDNYLQKHRERGNLKLHKAYNILKELDEDITTHDVRTVSAYNIYHDFKVVKDLLKWVSINQYPHDKKKDIQKFKTLKYDFSWFNPFRSANIKYLDLMHTVPHAYIVKLIKEGVKDDSVWYCIETKQLRTTRNSRKKGIYSAEYILKKFFDIDQTHFADDDVRDEAKLLEKLLQDVGEDKIEYNVFYPERLINIIDRTIREKRIDVPWRSKYD